jgi:hypothetical protein
VTLKVWSRALLPASLLIGGACGCGGRRPSGCSAPTPLPQAEADAGVVPTPSEPAPKPEEPPVEPNPE